MKIDYLDSLTLVNDETTPGRAAELANLVLNTPVDAFDGQIAYIGQQNDFDGDRPFPADLSKAKGEDAVVVIAVKIPYYSPLHAQVAEVGVEIVKEQQDYKRNLALQKATAELAEAEAKAERLRSEIESLRK